MQNKKRSNISLASLLSSVMAAGASVLVIIKGWNEGSADYRWLIRAALIAFSLFAVFAAGWAAEVLIRGSESKPGDS